MLVPTIVPYKPFLPSHLIALPISTVAMRIYQVAVKVAKLPMCWIWIIATMCQSLENNGLDTMTFP